MEFLEQVNNIEGVWRKLKKDVRKKGINYSERDTNNKWHRAEEK
jgi:hypothetical protein